MRIQFSACRLLKVDASSVTTSPMEGVGARKVAEVASVAELQAALDAYKAEIAATGTPAAVAFWQVKERGARAFRGFNEFKAAHGLSACLVGAESVTVTA